MKYFQKLTSKGGVKKILTSVVKGISGLASARSAVIRVPTVFITSTGEFVGNAVEIKDLLNNVDAMACIGQMMGDVNLQEKKENNPSELKGRSMDTGIGGANKIFVPYALATKHDHSILKSGNSWYNCTRCTAVFQTSTGLQCPECQGGTKNLQKRD